MPFREKKHTSLPILISSSQTRESLNYTNRLNENCKPNELKKEVTKPLRRKRTVSFDLSKNKIQVLPSVKAIKNTIKEREKCNYTDHAKFSTLSLEELATPLLPLHSRYPETPSLKSMNLVF